jgi:hypothetical protein
MTRSSPIRCESLVALREAKGFAHYVRFRASFALELRRFRLHCDQAGAPLPYEFNAMRLRLSIMRLASPNRLNNCAAFMLNPLYRVLAIIESHGYIPHVVSRGKEVDAKRRNPTKKARRWVVEVCHSWYNRF